MKISKTNESHFNIECSRDELSVLSNALNNIPQAVDEREYTTLIGKTKANVDKILKVLVTSLHQK